MSKEEAEFVWKFMKNKEFVKKSFFGIYLGISEKKTPEDTSGAVSEGIIGRDSIWSFKRLSVEVPNGFPGSIRYAISEEISEGICEGILGRTLGDTPENISWRIPRQISGEIYGQKSLLHFLKQSLRELLTELLKEYHYEISGEISGEFYSGIAKEKTAEDTSEDISKVIWRIFWMNSQRYPWRNFLKSCLTNFWREEILEGISFKNLRESVFMRNVWKTIPEDTFGASGNP